ncbi:PorV/PorQ family protein [bacterium]|nr:PorV/PorQ family protein [bacterium]
MKKSIFLILIVFTVYIFAGTSFDFRSGTSGFEFLRLPVGAANIALGQATIESVDNSLALYINPSRLEEVVNWDIRGGYSQWLLDTSYQYFTVAKRIGDRKGVFALGVKNVSYGEFTYTKPWGYIVDPAEDGTTFTGSATLASLSYGKQLTKNFAFGLTTNYAMETLENYTIDTVFANLGFSYENKEFLKGLRIGFTAENFGFSVKYFDADDSDPYTLPIAMRYALRWDFFQSKNNKHKVVIEANATQYKDENMFGTLGATYTFNGFLSLFGSYTTNSSYSPFATGLRIKPSIGSRMLWDLSFAYTMTEDFGSKMVFDLGVMLF